METLHKTILPRAGWLDVNGLDALLLEPLLHDLGDELRAVIAPQIFRGAVLRDGLLEPMQHVLGFQGPVRPQHMTFPRVFIQDRQQLQRSAAHGRVGNEVPGPHVVLMRGGGGQTRGYPTPNYLPFRRGHA